MFFEVFIADGFTGCHAYIPAGVEAPALGLDLLEGGGFAETGDVPEFEIGDLRFRSAKHRFELGFGFFPALRKVEGFAAIEADDVGDEADLCGCPVAVGAVHLAVDVPGVNKQNRVGTVLFTLTPGPSPNLRTLTPGPSPRGRGEGGLAPIQEPSVQGSVTV